MNRVADKLDSLNENEAYEVIQTTTLNEIINGNEEYLKSLNYLNIDLEFNDESILKSFDFKYYHPLVITIEIHHFNFYNKSSISNFLEQFNYSIYSYIKPTAIFVDNEFQKNKFKVK